MFEDRVLAYNKGIKSESAIVNTLTITMEELNDITEIEVCNVNDIAIFNLPKSDLIISGTFGMLNLDASQNSKVRLNEIKGEVTLSPNTIITNLEELLYNDDVDIKFYADINLPTCALCLEHVKGIDRIHICARLKLDDENEARDRINTPLFKIT